MQLSPSHSYQPDTASSIIMLLSIVHRHEYQHPHQRHHPPHHHHRRHHHRRRQHRHPCHRPISTTITTSSQPSSTQSSQREIRQVCRSEDMLSQMEVSQARLSSTLGLLSGTWPTNILQLRGTRFPRFRVVLHTGTSFNSKTYLWVLTNGLIR